MKLALVNTRIEPRQWHPINLLSLAAYVENICDVQVFDPDPTDKALWEILDWKPDVVGITAMSQTWWRAEEIARRLKLMRNPKIIVGGVHASAVPDEVIASPYVDAICIGEGEKVLKRYLTTGMVDGIYQSGGLIKDLDTLPMQAFHKFKNITKYMQPPGTVRGQVMPKGNIVIMTARGCFGKCIFCGSNIIFGRHIRKRSVDNVIAEITHIKETFGNVGIVICDDTFTVFPRWVQEFCEKIKPLGLIWSCMSRADGLTYERAKMMKDAGCVRADIGVESGSDHVLSILKKGVTRQQYIDAFNAAHKAKLDVGATFILGTPGETLADIEETKSFLRIAKPDMSIFFYLYPFPGTDLYKTHPYPIQRDSTGSQDIPLPLNENITPEEYIKIRNELLSIVKWRNLKCYISVQGFVFGFKILTFKGIWIFIETLILRGNIYDALYALLMDHRRKI